MRLLQALQLGSSHAILVGDPQQLPATIFSVSGRNTKFDRSLFQRLEDAGHPVHMLDTQYRYGIIVDSIVTIFIVLSLKFDRNFDLIICIYAFSSTSVILRLIVCIRLYRNFRERFFMRECLRMGPMLQMKTTAVLSGATFHSAFHHLNLSQFLILNHLKRGEVQASKTHQKPTLPCTYTTIWSWHLRVP